MLAGVLKGAAEAERVRALLRRIMENALEVPCTDRVESAATAQLGEKEMIRYIGIFVRRCDRRR